MIKQYPYYTLKRDTDPVMERNLEEAVKLSKRMLRISRVRGIGLAANQIGESLRVAVITLPRYVDPADEGLELVMFNPVVLSGSDLYDHDEGCLSLEKHGVITVPRYRNVKIGYKDEELNSRYINLTGLYAAIAQHEIDHLDGRTLLDRSKTGRRNTDK